MKQDILLREEIVSFLWDKDTKLYVHDTLESTNTEAKRLAGAGVSSGTAILADCQTGGRGRMGKSFLSPKGTGIYLSVILRHTLLTEELCLVTPAAAVAVCHAIEEACDVSPEIKWVNDLYTNGKKICGILTELTADALIIGIGVNCSTVFDGELAEIAGSLHQEGIRCRLAAEIINRIQSLEQVVKSKEFLTEYRSRSLLIGKEDMVVGEDSSYLAEDIGMQGELLLRAKDGTLRSLHCGEVSVRIK